MDFRTYFFRKSVEKLVIEAGKELIHSNGTIPKRQRQNMIATIDVCSTAKDICELVQMTKQHK